MLHTKSRGHEPSGSGEEDFKGFYHIWACRPSGSSDKNNLHKSIVRMVSEELCFNILMGPQYEWLG